ncbi:hypothetical protein DOO74_04105 [Rhodobacteraceae bacterium AsT-22]|nr:hypothetical protein DOO74_04105 [Rhodobacteraceae bacterium AsT-22]
MNCRSASHRRCFAVGGARSERPGRGNPSADRPGNRVDLRGPRLRRAPCRAGRGGRRAGRAARSRTAGAVGRYVGRSGMRRVAR